MMRLQWCRAGGRHWFTNVRLRDQKRIFTDSSMQPRLTFDHYSICRREDGSRFELGRGSAGVTYKALDVNLECPVALKVLNNDAFGDERSRTAFVREAQAAAKLRHPHIASVYHLGTRGDHFFYSMELIEGETVAALVARGGPLSPVVTLRIAAQVARALTAAARHEIIHRDIKPANLMVSMDASEAEAGLQVKVIGFGMAHLSQGDLPRQDGFYGTPQYASPEQAEERELDERSDLYSLGCTIWFMLTGRPPFTGTLANILVHRLQIDPPWAELQSFPVSLRNLLRIMLRRNPSERPRNGVEVQRAIESCLASIERRHNLGDRLGASFGRAHRWVATHSRTRTAALAGAAVLILTGGFAAWSRSEDAIDRDPVESAAHEHEESAFSEVAPISGTLNSDSQLASNKNADWLVETSDPLQGSQPPPVAELSIGVSQISPEAESPAEALPSPGAETGTKKPTPRISSAKNKSLTYTGRRAPFFVRMPRKISGLIGRLF